MARVNDYASVAIREALDRELVLTVRRLAVRTKLSESTVRNRLDLLIAAGIVRCLGRKPWPNAATYELVRGDV